MRVSVCVQREVVPELRYLEELVEFHVGLLGPSDAERGSRVGLIPRHRRGPVVQDNHQDVRTVGGSAHVSGYTRVEERRISDDRYDPPVFPGACQPGSDAKAGAHAELAVQHAEGIVLQSHQASVVTNEDGSAGRVIRQHRDERLECLMVWTFFGQRGQERVYHDSIR